jgi:hypothetical protein
MGKFRMKLGVSLGMRGLMLTNNYIQGKIPANLSGCSDLVELPVGGNMPGGKSSYGIWFLVRTHNTLFSSEQSPRKDTALHW